MKGGEFVRKVRALAKRKNIAHHCNPERGIGSCGTLYLGFPKYRLQQFYPADEERNGRAIFVAPAIVVRVLAKFV